MLRWTGSGAVTMPKTLQVRLQRTYPGRVRAGAPLPTRAMSTEEVIENINHFTTVSTRGQVVEAVVFTGVGAASRSDLERLCAHARERCVRRLVLHAGVEDLEQLPAVIPVDRLVLPLQVGEAAATLSLADSALRRAREAGLEVGANTVLSPTALPLLAAVARVVRHTGCQSLTFTYPFPVDGSQSSDVVPPPAAVAALREVVPLLEGISLDIKGLPICYLGELGRFVRRTANRWYVDADHQRERALLFFPDVVSFFKEEDCRFCAADGACDGFFATYLRRPGFAPLKPLEPSDLQER